MYCTIKAGTRQCDGHSDSPGYGEESISLHWSPFLSQTQWRREVLECLCNLYFRSWFLVFHNECEVSCTRRGRASSRGSRTARTVSRSWHRRLAKSRRSLCCTWAVPDRTRPFRAMSICRTRGIRSWAADVPPVALASVALISPLLPETYIELCINMCQL